MIYFLFITLFKLIASSFCKKKSRRVSSAVGAYWNPWVLFKNWKQKKRKQTNERTNERINRKLDEKRAVDALNSFPAKKLACGLSLLLSFYVKRRKGGFAWIAFEVANARTSGLHIKTESIRKLNNFNFQWTKTLYQHNLNYCILFYIFQGL